MAFIRDIAAGRDHSLVLGVNGRLLAWGGDGTGRFPPPANVCSVPMPASSAIVVRTPSPLQQVSASGGTSLGLDERGLPYLWGANRAGIGGRLAHILHESPQALKGLPPIARLHSSEFLSLALTRDGRLFAWGLVKHATQVSNDQPSMVRGLPTLAQCAVGGSHVLAIDQSCGLWGWGANAAGQLAQAHLQDEDSPVRIRGVGRAQAAAAGPSHSLAIDADGKVWAWGSNQHGQLGCREAAYSDIPLCVRLPERVAKIAAGMYVSYGLGVSGRLYAWGWNARGQLGQGDVLPHQGILTVALPRRIRQVVSGQGHVLASDGEQVWAWGDNTSGQLGREGGHSGIPKPLPAVGPAFPLPT